VDPSVIADVDEIHRLDGLFVSAPIVAGAATVVGAIVIVVLRWRRPGPNA